MPVYNPPINGISLSQALTEAAIIAPITRTVYHTFEIYNDAITTSLRIVRNNANILASLEDTAPLDPGTLTTFYAAGVETEVLQQAPDASSPQITMTIMNVNGEISKLLATCRGILSPWLIAERLYLSDDLTAPARLPVTTLTILTVDLTAEVAKLTLGFGESSKNPVPRLTFKVSEYPGLAAK